MNEEDFYNIPANIRSNPMLLAGYILNQQLNTPTEQNSTETSTDTATSNTVETGATNTTNNMTPEQASMYAAIAGTPMVGVAAPSVQAAQTAMTGLDNTSTETAPDGRFQFYNPYKGVDIPTASYLFGRNIGKGNVAGSIFSGLKVGLGTARNILSGVANQRTEDRAMQSFWDNQRKTVTGENTPTYYEDGGMQAPNEAQTADPIQQVMEGVAQALMQGATPEEVLKELLNIGMPEKEATEMIQYVMQTLNSQQQVGQSAQQEAPPTQEQPIMKNGGQYLDKLKGKTIKNYKLNPDTGNYEVEYE